MIKAILKSKRLGFFKKLALVLVLSMFGFIQTSSAALPQEIEIKGKVTEEATGEPLIGVSVVIKGSTVGTITDFDGNYTLKVNNGDFLVFSYIGYMNKEVPVTGASELNVAMETDNVGLDEVVVVGYGVQKKKLNTGANLNMKGEDLAKLNTGDAMSSLQGISPGVSITQASGRPGAGTKVYIRGIGTIGNAKPLYVVDGVQVDNIDYLSPSDIESLDVLKDGASAAIYGSQAANGVILVTTKKAKKGQAAVISYDTYVGWQNVANMPDMLNAQDYAKYMNEGLYNSTVKYDDDGNVTTFKEYDFENMVPDWENIENGTNPGTNWFDEYVNHNAIVQNHSLNVMGSNNKSTYSMGASYMYNEGLLGSHTKSEYKRLNLRLNSEHVLKEYNDLDLITLGQNLTYTNTENPSIADGNMYWNDTRNVLVASPFLPIYNADDDYHYALDASSDADPYDNVTKSWDESSNPLGHMNYNRSNNENNNNKIVGNAYLEIQPIKNLKIRSSFGIDNWSSSSRNYVPLYKLSPTDGSDYDEVTQRVDLGYKWIITNTAAYNFNYQEMHNFNVVVGQEAQKVERSLYITGQKQETLFGDFEHAYFNNSTAIIDPASLDSKDQFGWALSSYFGRLSYDLQEKYLLTLVYRMDGSSNFAPDNRYDDFKSVSAGWILSQENFMSAVPALDYMKLRFSWGENGNQAIPAFQDVAQISYDDAQYPFGTDKQLYTIGSALAQLPNPNLRWETSVQSNLGLDMNFLNSRLQTTFDWYNKTTTDWLVKAPSLLTFGADAPDINGGTIVNKGVELMLKWSDQQGDFKYSITGTMAYNKNEITAIDNDEKIIHGLPNVLTHATSEIYRAEVGYPIGYFWGFETAGIFKNDAEVEAYVNEMNARAEALNPDDPRYDSKLNKFAPGEVIFVDKNGDGYIDDEDKGMIGDPNPDYTYGVQISLDYKNAYLQIVGSGKAGHQIAKSWRSFSNSPKHNFSYTDVEKTWHAERNPNGTMPQLQSKATFSTKAISDIYMQDANYFRISNITIGYSFKDLIKTDIFSDLKVYATAQNLMTFTKYDGMDPEVGYGPTDNNNPANHQPWASGIDLGLYPLSRTYMLGLSVKF